MARPLRFQYPGAVHHVMARGDGGDAVFETADDRKAFLSRLGEVCGSHGWRIHAWLLRSNHFHLLLETPAGEWGDGDEVFAWCLQPRLEARAANDGGAIDAEATKSLKRGWYLGKESFKDRLLKLLEKPAARTRSGGAARGAGPVRDRGEKEAARLLAEGTRELGLPGDRKGLEGLKKSDPRKMRLAALLRAQTTVSNEWIADKLAMGHPGSVSRLVALCRSDREGAAEVKKLSCLLIHED